MVKADGYRSKPLEEVKSLSEARVKAVARGASSS